MTFKRAAALLLAVLMLVLSAGCSYLGGETASSEESSELVLSSVPAEAEIIRDNIRAEVDKLVDFFDEYTDFMKSYREAEDPDALAEKYGDFTSRLTDAMEALNAMETRIKELTNAEVDYLMDALDYIEDQLEKIE